MHVGAIPQECALLVIGRPSHTCHMTSIVNSVGGATATAERSEIVHCGAVPLECMRVERVGDIGLTGDMPACVYRIAGAIVPSESAENGLCGTIPKKCSEVRAIGIVRLSQQSNLARNLSQVVYIATPTVKPVT